MIVIIDYGMGNLRSVQKGFERMGHQAVVTSDPDEVGRAAKVVLPGVGACKDAMSELRQRNLIEPILESINSGRPFLGICLGLQLLFDVSHEYGRHAGLGVLRGDCVRFELPQEYSVPHMGWNRLLIRRRPPILEGIEEAAQFYFVHSYYVVPSDREVIASETDYHTPFCSMIWRNNLFATQFHPEKSQSNGLKILDNFAKLL